MSSNRHISIFGVIVVRSPSTAGNPNKPRLFTTICDFLSRKDGLLSIPVLHFSRDEPPAEGSIVYCMGELYFPPGDEEEIVDANVFQVICGPEDGLKIAMAPACISAIGKLKSVVDRQWHLEVEVFERRKMAQKTFNIVITIPDDSPRFKRLSPPAINRLVAVRGVLSSVESYTFIPSFDLEGVTFISFQDGSHSSHSSSQSSNTTSSGGGKSKRQLCSDKLQTPMKKTKVGPADAFLTGSALESFQSHSSGSDPSLSSPSASTSKASLPVSSGNSE